MKIGSDVSRYKVGDRVVVNWAGHALYSVKPEGLLNTRGIVTNPSAMYNIRKDALVRIPDNVGTLDASFANIASFSFNGVRKLHLEIGESAMIAGQGILGVFALQVAALSGAVPLIAADFSPERRALAKKLGADYALNPGDKDYLEQIKEITGGEMAHQVMECSGANPAIRQTFDLVSNAGRITLTGWPKKETSLPTDVITKKEIDIRGARTSAGEFEEALDLINSRKVDMMKILTKTVTMDEAPDTIVDIEKNPGNYMKVVVRVSNDD